LLLNNEFTETVSSAVNYHFCLSGHSLKRETEECEN